MTFKYSFPKVEHPKFEGHVMPNKDEYQKSVWLKVSYCLGVSLFVTCTPAEKDTLKLAIITTFRPHDLDLGSGHTVV